MSFFPAAMYPDAQILWQPVTIQQLQNETIEQLRRENNMLKYQLEAVLTGTPSQMTNHTERKNNFQHHPIATDRFFHSPCQPLNFSKRPNENSCLSPRLMSNHQYHCNYSPRVRACMSPSQPLESQRREQEAIATDPRAKRMVISKGKDGRYYRDLTQQNQQSYLNLNTHSCLNRVHTQDTSLKSMTTPIKSPLKRSHFLNNNKNQNLNFQTESKPTSSRLKSPTFLKERHKNIIPIQNAQIAEVQHFQQHQSFFQRSPRIKQNYQHGNKQNQIRYEPLGSPEEKNRKLVKMPTVELSDGDCDLSIERVVQQLRKGKKKTKCDTFLFEIEQALQEMYQKQEQ